MKPQRFRFNRLELAGSLGDLGTLLPIAIGMILINGLDPAGLFISVGLYYVLSGIYFGVTVPVQPMKVIGAYAIAMALPASQIMAAGLLMGGVLLLIGGTGAINLIGRFTPTSVVRGVQLSTGALLMAKGIHFIVGTSTFQTMQSAVEPYLSIQSIGPIPIGIFIGIIGGVLTLLLLDNRKFPAGLLVVLYGILIGVLLGTHDGFAQLRPGLYLPGWLPLGWPSPGDFSLAFIMLVLPQIPMTVGNAVIAYSDLSGDYFGAASRKVTYRSACISMALANIGSVLAGGMPLCHGAGGLAAHYRFGARTAGSNIIIGMFFVLLVVLFGPQAPTILHLLPMAVLGILLVFAGCQLALTVIDMRERKDLFIVITILGITLATNLAAGFIIGLLVAHALKSDKLRV